MPRFNFAAVFLKMRCSSDLLEQVVQVCAEHKKPKKLLKHLRQIEASTGTACCLSSLVTSKVSQYFSQTYCVDRFMMHEP